MKNPEYKERVGKIIRNMSNEELLKAYDAHVKFKKSIENATSESEVIRIISEHCHEDFLEHKSMLDSIALFVALTDLVINKLSVDEAIHRRDVFISFLNDFFEFVMKNGTKEHS